MAVKDKHYVDRCLDGHPDDFHHLVRRYQHVLTAHLVGKLGDGEQAQEAAQETLVRCYFNLSKLRKRDSFFAWMLGISNRVVKEHLRSEHRRKEALSSIRDRSGASRNGYDYPLAQTIARLPDFCRELILLRYYGGNSCKEIAEQLDMPLGTITKTLSRAYGQLRELLRDEQSRRDCEVQI